MSLLPLAQYEPNAYIWYLDNGVEKVFEKDLTINSLYIYRLPMLKVAPFAVLTISLPSNIIAAITDSMNKSYSVRIHIALILADTRDPRSDMIRTYNFDHGMRADFVFKVLHTVNRFSPPATTAEIVPITYYLAPHQIHELTMGNAFNRQFRNRTALEVLESFEGHVRNFVDMSGFPNPFSFKKIVSIPNNHSYQNILIKSDSDINVPIFLLRHYKLLNTFGYYFFDCCHLDNMNVGLLIDLSNPGPFQIWNGMDPDKYELYRGLKLIHSLPMTNELNVLRRSVGASAIVVKEPTANRLVTKGWGNRGKPGQPVGGNTGGGGQLGGRGTGGMNNVPIPSNANPGQTGSGETMVLHAPDFQDNARQRYTNMIQLLNLSSGSKMFDTLYTFEGKGVHIDAIQFDKKYVLDMLDTSAYYIPISIVNKFAALGVVETHLEHTVEFQAIMY